MVANFNTVTLFVIAEDLANMASCASRSTRPDVGQVKAGQRATFTVDAYPGRRFPATLERVDLASAKHDHRARRAGVAQPLRAGGSVVSYEALLAVENRDGFLRPGMTATATIANAEIPARRCWCPTPPCAFVRKRKRQVFGGRRLQSADRPSKEQKQQGKHRRWAAGSRCRSCRRDSTLRAIEVVTGTQRQGAEPSW